MKRYLFLALVFFLFTGCAHRTPPLMSDLTQETWARELYTDPAPFMRGASNWFLTGDPNALGMAPSPSPYFPAIFSTLNVQVSNFTQVKINGDFQVQLFGTEGPNSVTVYGPNDGVRETLVDVKNGVLCVNQVKKPRCNLRSVIVRIGVNCLNDLEQFGSGRIEGIRLQSNFLKVGSYGSGNIYLAGNLNLKLIRNVGSGIITVMGANTPELDVQTDGFGTTNISGNVGVRNIQHYGRNDINIIGANSNFLKIYARGMGKIGVSGNVSLAEVRAYNATRVYVDKIHSGDLHAFVYGRARVGLAGEVRNVFLDAYQASCVAARHLCADTVFVRAYDTSHVNVSASRKAFIAATESAGVYYFGEQSIMTPFMSGYGLVTPIRDTGPCCANVNPVYQVRYKAIRVMDKTRQVSIFPYR